MSTLHAAVAQMEPLVPEEEVEADILVCLWVETQEATEVGMETKAAGRR